VNLLAYGTLMDVEIWEVVTGRTETPESAVLDGYTRHPVAGEVYPAIVERDQGSVAGVVYGSLAARELDRLDRFEGRLYERRTVTVQTARGVRLETETYVLAPGARCRLGDGDWSFERFLAEGKATFIRRL